MKKFFVFWGPFLDEIFFSTSTGKKTKIPPPPKKKKNSEWGLREAGSVARVFARSLEDASLLPHSLAELVPSPAADPAVVDFLQGATLLLGFFGAAAFTRRLGARPWAQLTPQLVGISLVTAELWYLIV